MSNLSRVLSLMPSFKRYFPITNNSKRVKNHKFLELFDSEEPREREYLKNILHRLYAKLVPRRKMIRKAINDCFHSLIHENVKFNGAPELLDILARSFLISLILHYKYLILYIYSYIISIISGFAVPLREEHIIFFKNIVIPLHKVPHMQTLMIGANLIKIFS